MVVIIVSARRCIAATLMLMIIGATASPIVIRSPSVQLHAAAIVVVLIITRPVTTVACGASLARGWHLLEGAPLVVPHAVPVRVVPLWSV